MARERDHDETAEAREGTAAPAPADEPTQDDVDAAVAAHNAAEVAKAAAALDEADTKTP
jgi:hypothetical protein